jgi:RNA polymerase sigma factor (sigma-70 family)
VIKITKELRHRGVAFEDLLHEGFLGLIEAARRFDADRGVRFTTYSAWWIRKFILKAIRDQSRVVRIPDHRLRIVRAAREANSELEQSLGRRSCLHDDAATHDEISLGDHRGGDDLPSPIDSVADPGTLSPEQMAIRSDLERRMSEAAARLSARAWRILRDRFGLDGVAPLTLKEVGEREGISRERARQIEAESIRRLRRALTRRRPIKPALGASR